MSDDTVWVATGYDTPSYHTNPDCRRLNSAETIVTKSQSVVDPLYDECQSPDCAGERESQEFETSECPGCGEKFGNVALHLRSCHEVGSDD
jgi:hypothetical protein